MANERYGNKGRKAVVKKRTHHTPPKCQDCSSGNPKLAHYGCSRCYKRLCLQHVKDMRRGGWCKVCYYDVVAERQAARGE